VRNLVVGTTKYSHMTSEVGKKNFMPIGQDLTYCQSLFIWFYTGKNQKQLAIGQILTEWPEIFFGDPWGHLEVLGIPFDWIWKVYALLKK